MGARNKLNAAHIHGALIVAGLAAAIFGSWPLFWLIAIVLVATATYSGDIRPRGRR